MITIYIIGCIIAFIFGCILLYKEEDKINIQCGMIAPMTILSWITVFIVIWRYKLFK